MLDSSSTKPIFTSRRSIVFAIVFLTFFVLISMLSFFTAPVRNYYFLQYNQTQVSTIFAHYFSNSTTNPPQFSRKFKGFSSNHEFSSKKSMEKSSDHDEIPNRTKGESMEAPSNHDYSSEKPSSDSRVSNYTNRVEFPQESVTISRNESLNLYDLKKKKMNKKNWVEKISRCRFFSGRWVKDQRHPLYAPGSCTFIDESFDCFMNGKPENAYEKYRWLPYDCELPRWNGKKMLRLLKGKRLVYIGDSLNRNMWESMVCMLRNAVHNQTNVYEISRRREFRSEGSYSFVFKDYNFSVEFFRSPFLVREWEMPDTNGSTKETLRLDLVERSSDLYKNADILVFNTGHWWTHEKTAAGKGYYQEGDHVYDQLHVMDAFKKAMTTWGQWIDANVSRKTLVIFRGYSSSHFSGGQWNSGGQCDGETEPIVREKDLPHEDNRVITEAVESILTKMKSPVFYLNITRMSEFRKDAHPSMYVKPNITIEERNFQDCSHWCLPGVPDTWNEIVYAQLLFKYEQQLQLKKINEKLG